MVLLNIRTVLLSIVTLALLSGCSNVFFIPMKQHVRTPDNIGLAYQDIYFKAQDGTELHAWFLPAKSEPKASILFLHGNAENISTHIGSVYWLPEHGFNVLLLDYRGYGKSEGAPTQEGVHLDADAALAALVEMPGTQSAPVILYGQSLGAAIATYTSAHSKLRHIIDATIIESGFSGYRTIAREKLDAVWLTKLFQHPLSYTVGDDFNPKEAIQAISPIPVLLVYSEQDQVIPPHHGRDLFNAARQPKQLWMYESGRHIGIFQSPERQQRLLDYLNDVIKRSDNK